MRISRVTARPRCAITRRTSRLRPSRRLTVSQALSPFARSSPASIGAVAHALDRHALCQRRQRRAPRAAVHAHAIAAEPAGRRQLQLPRQRAVIGQQQQPLAGQVEPADADHARQSPGQFVEHGRPALRIAMRRHQAVGLVIAPQAGAFGASTSARSPPRCRRGRRTWRDASPARCSAVLRPSASSFSASRRLATPARASHLAIRSPRAGVAHPRRQRSGRRRSGGRPGRCRTPGATARPRQKR